MKRKIPYVHIDWDKARILFDRPVPLSAPDRKYPSAKQILHVVAAAGAVGALFIFPGAAPALGALVLGKQTFSRWGTRRVIDQLVRQKYLSVKSYKDGKVTVTITKRGMVRALTYSLDTMQIHLSKRWDHKWRVVIFDIPETDKKIRDLFRLRLGQLGMYQLQESVFISPHPCFDEIEFLRELYGVSFSVQYLLVEKLEDDGYLRKRFEID